MKYITRLPLLYIYSMMAIDKKAFERLSAADQVLVLDGLNKVFSTIDAYNRRDNQAAYEALLAQGIIEVQPSPEQLLEWRARAATSIADVVASGSISQASIELIQQYLGEVRRAGAAGASD